MFLQEWNWKISRMIASTNAEASENDQFVLKLAKYSKVISNQKLGVVVVVCKSFNPDWGILEAEVQKSNFSSFSSKCFLLKEQTRPRFHSPSVLFPFPFLPSKCQDATASIHLFLKHFYCLNNHGNPLFEVQFLWTTEILFYQQHNWINRLRKPLAGEKKACQAPLHVELINILSRKILIMQPTSSCRHIYVPYYIHHKEFDLLLKCPPECTVFTSVIGSNWL